ncbi:hypothetical protein B0J12DRAFT_735503 [Macrophomina phaseolina]|uniref:Hydrophobin n=1 Tax=Macrophomina phaseolina TaxID=35725 RepID=A0ABQ8GT11_9PEZI|nr:hypothetical protein B0J12DRAFT_735503 [Macrophomina phaseolina]
MQLTTITAIAVAMALASATAITQPKPHARAVLSRQAGICPGIESPQCCQLDVAGLASLTCSSPGDVADIPALRNACAASGTTALCCTLVLGSDALLCNDV